MFIFSYAKGNGFIKKKYQEPVMISEYLTWSI